jgi:hypothetical protein
MGDPAVLQQADQNGGGAVFNQVRAVDEHDGGPAPAGFADVPGALAD